MNGDTAVMNAIPAVDEHLGQLASSLFQTLQQAGAEPKETKLEHIYHYFRDKTWKQSSSDALLQTWSACALLLDEDLTSEVSRETEPKRLNLTMRRAGQPNLKTLAKRSRRNHWFERSRPFSRFEALGTFNASPIHYLIFF
jgi:hypothetical protein